MGKYRSTTANMLKLLDEAEVNKLIARVTGVSDVVKWQECTRDHRENLRAIPGWDHYFSKGLGGLAISWRSDRFEVHREGRSHGIVPGSRFFHDPTRGFIDIVLQDLTDGELVAVLDTHATHQAWTSHPERRPRWRLLAYRLRLRMRRLARRWGRADGGGDVNRSRWAPKGTRGVWAAEPTHGRAYYDVTFLRGAIVTAGAAQAIRTPSDHHALTVALRTT